MDPFVVGALFSKKQDVGFVLVIGVATSVSECDKRVHLEWRQRIPSLARLIKTCSKKGMRQKQEAIQLCKRCVVSLIREPRMLEKSHSVENQVAALIREQYEYFCPKTENGIT
jgi:hypothetical protein